ncbi:ABC transporter substrate-binding protein [Actinomadura geliboluensis]|uniref:ABC transporter substrate-binding protein n=1 Tax=Actinomadura geliboluensis TaxID=882440 RepID=UPI003711FB3B
MIVAMISTSPSVVSSAVAGAKNQRHRTTVARPGDSLRRISCAVAIAVSLALTAACGGSGGQENAGGLERPHLTVGTLPVPDAAPLFIAREKGLFKREGLDVKVQIIQAGPMAVPSLQSGTLDIALTNYVSAITAAEKGMVHWKFLADSYQAGPGAFVVLALPGSPIKTEKDLAGKKIAVPALKAIGTLMISATLASHNVSGNAAEFVEMPFPQMPAALQQKRVDAIWAAEPFITAAQTLGAHEVMDTCASGSLTVGFPVAGWGTLDFWLKKNPKTAAAFQRAIGEAQQQAAADRGLVSKILPKYIKGITPDTAQLVTLGTYPTTLDAGRLQRVADLMQQYGYIERKVDVAGMIARQPAHAQ